MPAYLDSALMHALLDDISTSFPSSSHLSKLATVCLSATAVSQPISRQRPNVWGRQASFLSNNATFGVADTICGLAKSEAFLLLKRTIAGLGGGKNLLFTHISVPDVVPLRKSDTATAIGYTTYDIGLPPRALLENIWGIQFAWDWSS